MMIQITPKELMKRGLYKRAEEVLDINPYAISEGLLDSDEPLQLSGVEAKEIGLIDKIEDN